MGLLKTFSHFPQNSRTVVHFCSPKKHVVSAFRATFINGMHKLSFWQSDSYPLVNQLLDICSDLLNIMVLYIIHCRL